jgi:hypothetical protein
MCAYEAKFFFLTLSKQRNATAWILKAIYCAPFETKQKSDQLVVRNPMATITLIIKNHDLHIIFIFYFILIGTIISQLNFSFSSFPVSAIQI